jgi:hypothetical protein
MDALHVYRLASPGMHRPFVTLLFLVLLLPLRASAQEAAVPDRHSPLKAFALSLALPGLGHRYVHGGDWDGAASAFVVAEAGFWTGVLVANWRHDQAVESYETLAATRADAQVDDKDRRFFLELATYRSSDDYLADKLRDRAWDQIGYVSDPAFQWAWQTEADFLRYRELRDEADTFSNRRTLFIATLVANRLIAGLTAVRAARRANQTATGLSLSFAPPPAGAHAPLTRLRVQF